MKEKNKLLKQIIRTIIYVLVVIIMLFYITRLLSPVGNEAKWWEINKTLEVYKESKNSIDIAFIGASTFIEGIQPMYLYDKYDIKSYDLCISGQDMFQSYYMLKQFFKMQSPKYVFIDTSMFFNDNVAGKKEENTIILNFMKNPYLRVEMLKDKDNLMERDSLIQEMFLVRRYHDRWKSLKEWDFVKMKKPQIQETDFKGSDVRFQSVGREKVEGSKGEIDIGISDYTIRSFERILDLCKKYKAVPVLAMIREDGDVFKEERQKAILEIKDKYGLEFFDTYNTDMDIDFKSDYYDDGRHFNYRGQRKISNVVGYYIVNDLKYVPDSKNKEDKNWQKEYKRYVAYLKEKGNLEI